LKRFLALVVANMKMSVRNWQALFWMFMFPIIIMGLLGIVFGNGDQKAQMGIVDQDHTQLSKSIVESFEKISSVNLNKGSKEKELKLIKNGKLDAVIVIGKGFSKSVPKPVLPKPVVPDLAQNMKKGQQYPGNVQSPQVTDKKQVLPVIPQITYEPKTPAKIELHYDPSKIASSQMARMSVRAIFSQMEKSISKAPALFQVKETREAPKDMDFIDFLLPGIIGMAIMSNGIFGLSTAIVTYREKGILRRLKITPLPLSTFLGARVVTQVLISFFQTAILIAFAMLAFGVHITGNYFALALTVFIGSLCFINIGFLVSSIANTTETADTVANIINMPMMFLAGIFFPVDNVPAWIRPLVNILPLKFLADALRDISIKGKSIYSVQSELYTLLGMTVVFFILAIVFFRWESKAT
jgi:ABC-2 type transport system permease protein